MDSTKIYSLSPSAAARWCACPGSEHIIRQLPRLPSTAAAEEGTLAHEFAAWALACTLRDVAGLTPYGGMPKEPEQALATEDMLNAAQAYADAVLAKVYEVFGEVEPEHCAYDIEAPCSLDVPSIRINGRLDFAAYQRDKAIIVADFKFGGSPVPVKDNPQLLSYAMCVADDCVRKLGKMPPRIIIGVVQPRSEISDFGGYGGAMWYEYSPIDFHELAREIKDKAHVACNADDSTPRAPGEHCKYCPARSVCRAAIGEKLLLAGIAAGEAEMHEDATNEQIGAWLSALKDMDTVREDLIRIAKARIAKGEAVPGWRTQSRRTLAWCREIRELSGVQAQAAALAARLGGAAEDYLSTSLKSPAQMTKTLPKDTLNGATEETTTVALVSAAGGK